MANRPKNHTQSQKPKPAEKPIDPPEDEIEFLPKKDMLRIDETARYFSVSDRTIRRWVGHGHLATETVGSTVFVTRKSIVRCRFQRNTDIQG